MRTAVLARKNPSRLPSTALTANFLRLPEQATPLQAGTQQKQMEQQSPVTVNILLPLIRRFMHTGKRKPSKLHSTATRAAVIMLQELKPLPMMLKTRSSVSNPMVLHATARCSPSQRASVHGQKQVIVCSAGAQTKMRQTRHITRTAALPIAGLIVIHRRLACMQSGKQTPTP